MIFQVFFAVIIGRIKGYHVWKALANPAFYPFYVVELIYIVFQANVLLGNYSFISYASVLKTASLYVLLIPIFVHKLYVPALVGSGFIVTGTVLNEIVKYVNSGKMPVYPTLSRVTGYFSDAALRNSSLHTLGGPDTKLTFLSDYIDVGYSVLSIGDLFVHMFTLIIFYYGIKTISQHISGGKVSG